MSASTRESLVTSLVQDVARTVSNVLDRGIGGRGWADLAEGGRRAASALLAAVEQNSLLLARVVTAEKIIIKPTDNIREWSTYEAIG